MPPECSGAVLPEPDSPIMVVFAAFHKRATLSKAELKPKRGQTRDLCYFHIGMVVLIPPAGGPQYNAGLNARPLIWLTFRPVILHFCKLTSPKAYGGPGPALSACLSPARIRRLWRGQAFPSQAGRGRARCRWTLSHAPVVAGEAALKYPGHTPSGVKCPRQVSAITSVVSLV